MYKVASLNAILIEFYINIFRKYVPTDNYNYYTLIDVGTSSNRSNGNKVYCRKILKSLTIRKPIAKTAF